MSNTTPRSDPLAGFEDPPHLQFKRWLCTLEWGNYSYNRAPSLTLRDSATGEPIAIASICLSCYPAPPYGHTFIKDYAENEGMLKVLTDAGIVADTGRRFPVGYVDAALVRLLKGPFALVSPNHA